MDKYIVKNGKKLRYGYTTGSCATAVSTAGTIMLITGKRLEDVYIDLPNGEQVIFNISVVEFNDNMVICQTIKDGGDDPDATDGAKIIAKVTFSHDDKNHIRGGEGVGVVTVKGLQCGIGEPAINPTPKKMILQNINKVLQERDCNKKVDVEISVENGREIAKKTYNERLGIIGGISILGTTGIVEPMSEKALVDTIKVLIDKQYSIDKENILISPGNYGEKFCKEYLTLDINKAVKVSNYIGEALDYIKYKGFKKILLVGHTGKLVKIAAGIMNTHSSYADGRMEVIGVHSAIEGASQETIEKIMKSITTDEAFDIIKDKEYYFRVKDRIMEKVLYHLNYRLKNDVDIEVVMFTTDKNHIIMSDNAKELIKYFAEECNEG
ncbi:MAG: cobalt-precorrin-5B (C(1))-methyltransferase CbiD [Eubacteriales bacterium]|nr:cobalt-precorrin-5B (C(1))-methyltransferase CbiD [Eubacteriales bacterium]